MKFIASTVVLPTAHLQSYGKASQAIQYPLITGRAAAQGLPI